MATTPIMRNAGPEELKWYGPAMAQLRILKQQMGITGLKMGRREVTLAEGVTCLCNICFNLEEVFVKVASVAGDVVEVLVITVEGIILHPRSGAITLMHYYTYTQDSFGIIETTSHSAYGVIGGWANGTTALTSQYLFPLMDNDNASFVDGYESTSVDGVVTDTQAKSMFSAPGMYGNLYWTNDAVWSGAAWSKPFKSLSWHGTPTRHGRVPSNCNIPGISTVESVHSGEWDDVVEYTTFGSYLYKGGNVFVTAPRYSWPDGYPIDRCLILGAMQNSDGVTFIVTQNDHYNAPGFTWVLSNGETFFGDAATDGADRISELNNATPQPDPLVRIVKTATLTKPGFFIGVWSNVYNSTNRIRRDGWELLLEVSCARAGLPWFGNLSGTAFVCSNGDAITLDGFVASYTKYNQPEGTSNQSLATDNRYEVALTLEATGLTQFYEYAQDVKVNGSAALSFSAGSVQGGGEWGEATESPGWVGEPTGHTIWHFTDTSVDVFDVHEYCHVVTSATAEEIATLDRATGYAAVQAYEYSPPGYTNRPCIGVDWLQEPLPYTTKGEMRMTRRVGSIVLWLGNLPGSEHTINTDFTVNVCGVNIPIIKTDRYFKNERTPHSSAEAETAGYVKCWIQESCDIQKSTIHFLDERYGVCLYKTTHDVINLPRKQSQEVDSYFAYGTIMRSATLILRPDDYTATTTETWHLVVGGVDTVIATTELEIYPFGEPLSMNGYEDIVEVFCMPKVPASASVPPGSGVAAYYGSYEDGYDDPFGTQAQVDGGIDYFYPEWCRYLQTDPFWASAAASRYSFTAPGATYDPAGAASYIPPEVVVEPIPVGAFVRHPMLADMYQFLISKFDGSHIVVSSASINAKIDEALAGGLATHDTTLYYPISIV